MQEILKKFNVSAVCQPLEGGQGRCFKCGDYVVKPIDDVRVYQYICQLITQLKPSGYRLDQPLKSVNHQYVEDGYALTRFQRGVEDDNRLSEKLMISHKLHDALEKFDTCEFPAFESPWENAHRIIWHNKPWPSNLDKNSISFIKTLLASCTTVKADYQVIHADLGGNILFDDDLPPLVIDMSPAVAPVAYADAIIICDSIAWAGQSLNALQLLGNKANYKPYVERAIIFRILTTLFFEHSTFETVQSEWLRFKPIWDYL